MTSASTARRPAMNSLYWAVSFVLRIYICGRTIFLLSRIERETARRRNHVACLVDAGESPCLHKSRPQRRPVHTYFVSSKSVGQSPCRRQVRDCNRCANASKAAVTREIESKKQTLSTVSLLRKA
jgi:hypothetical protein